MFKALIENQYFKEVFDFLKDKSLKNESFIVGGTVRDLILNRNLNDLDIVVKENSLEIAREFSNKIDGTFILLDEFFCIGRVVKNGFTIDFTELRGSSIEEDLSERDFTINAVALTLNLKRVIDPFGGIDDLNKSIIRMVREENLKEDPLRVLRAYRFHATLNFSIEDNTREALIKNAYLLKNTAKERIKEELWIILLVSESAKTVKLMIEDAIFNSIFKSSEFIVLPPKLQSLINFEEFLKNPRKIFSSFRIQETKDFICPLKFALLFDFQALSFLRQIKPSKKEERLVESLLEASSWIRKIETLLDKVAFIKKFEKILYPVLLYSISQDPLGIGRAWFYKEIENFYRRTYLKNKRKIPIIRGDELIGLGFKPSPLIGEILEKIEILALMGKISTKEEAEKFIRSKFSREIS